jgi:hypothetical protein
VIVTGAGTGAAEFPLHPAMTISIRTMLFILA